MYLFNWLIWVNAMLIEIWESLVSIILKFIILEVVFWDSCQVKERSDSGILHWGLRGSEFIADPRSGFPSCFELRTAFVTNPFSRALSGGGLACSPLDGKEPTLKTSFALLPFLSSLPPVPPQSHLPSLRRSSLPRTHPRSRTSSTLPFLSPSIFLLLPRF